MGDENRSAGIVGHNAGTTNQEPKVNESVMFKRKKDRDKQSSLERSDSL
jgi:hypothetical protein